MHLLLQKEEIADGFRAMASERARWLMRPSHIVRAARHYEGAAQILIRHAVMSARKVQPASVFICSSYISFHKFYRLFKLPRLGIIIHDRGFK